MAKIVVVGAGLTGLESAAEMPQRLRDALGQNENVRVVIVDSAPEVGAGMGAEPGAVIRQALRGLPRGADISITPQLEWFTVLVEKFLRVPQD